MAGLWELPGGKVEDGESPEHALIRELREELGLEVRVSDAEAFSFVSHAYEMFHLLMPVFLIRRWDGNAEAREGQTFVWVSANEIGRYPAPEADLPLYERFVEWTRAGRI